jgi:hypothetical protein
MYQTIVFPDRWACPCGNDVPAEHERMAGHEAATQARRHVDANPGDHTITFAKGAQR